MKLFTVYKIFGISERRLLRKDPRRVHASLHDSPSEDTESSSAVGNIRREPGKLHSGSNDFGKR